MGISRRRLFGLVFVALIILATLLQTSVGGRVALATTATVSPRPGGPTPTTLPASGPAYLVKDIVPGAANGDVLPGVDLNGSYYFVARSASTSGYGLWRSDGTSAGTVEVKSFTSQPYPLVLFNGALYFGLWADAEGGGLWKSDGTAAGTVLVKDPAPGFAGSVDSLKVVGTTLYLVAEDSVNGAELWKSDGSSAGTVLVKDINPGVAYSSPYQLTGAGATLFFIADNGVNGAELWKSDGTTAGTLLVKDINPGSAHGNPNYLVNVAGTLFFTAYDGVNGNELWRSDGTSAGTVLVRNIYPEATPTTPPPTSGTGGTATPTRTPTLGICCPPAPDNVGPLQLAALGSTLFFTANDGSNGRELWRSDGTAGGTLLVKDIWAGSGSGSRGSVFSAAGAIWFVGGDSTTGGELWKSDGTAAGTVLVKDIYLGGGGSSIQGLTGVPGGYVYFNASDGYNGTELWRSDGSDAGTQPVQNIAPGGASAHPGGLVMSLATGRLFFSATDTVAGWEQWAVQILSAPQPTFTSTPTRTRTSTATRTPTSTSTTGTNLLLNGGFETDANGDGDPDSWTTHANITRSSAARRSGTYAIRHQSTTNNAYVISQTVSGIAAGASYGFSGWTMIPATSDAFTYRVELLWRNSSNSTLRTDLVRSYTASTSGTWTEAAGSVTAPTGATNVVVRMNVSSLNATIYSDDFSLTRAAPTPTNTSTATATATQPSGALPDLTFSYSIQRRPNCMPGQIGIMVTVRNAGTAGAGSFIVDVNTARQSVSSLAVGQEVFLWFPGLISSTTITVDVTQVVQESNENNNSATFTSPTMTPPPACTPTPTASPSPTLPSNPLPDLVVVSMEPGSTYSGCAPLGVPDHLLVTVRNNGNAAADSSEVQLNGTQNVLTGFIAAGQSVTVGFTSGYTLGAQNTARADATSLVQESNEANNALTVFVPQPTPTTTCTATPVASRTPTPTRTPTTVPGTTCSPAATITAPFVIDGAGTHCWQIATIPSFINSFNLNSLTVNGVNFTNMWAATSQLPPQVNGFWYISYNSSVAWGHFEAK